MRITIFNIIIVFLLLSALQGGVTMPQAAENDVTQSALAGNKPPDKNENWYDAFSSMDNDFSYVMVPKEIYTEENQNFSFKIYEKVNLKDMQIPLCSELPVSTERCLPSICVDKTAYGNIYRKIIGPDEEKKICRYAERTINLGGLDCSLPFDNTQTTVIGKYIASFSDNTIKLNEAESKQWVELMQSKCKVINEDRFVRKITLQNLLLNTDQQIQNFLQDVLISNTSHAATNAKKIKLTATTGEGQTLPEYDGKVWNIPTISFYPNESAAIQAAINRVQLTQEDEEDQGAKSSFFYVNSIFYASAKEWAVWINGRKISADAPNNYISVEDISHNYATLKWVTVNLDQITPNWRSFLLALGEDRYQSSDGKIRISIKDKTITEIRFDLSLNQTFSVNSMSIIEGKPNRGT